MEVSVVKLRFRGVKLPAEQVKTIAPTCGALRLSAWHLKNGREDRIVKELILLPSEDAHCSPTMRLEAPVQTKLERHSMVYIGVEKIDGETSQQAWFVRLGDRELASTGGRNYARAGKRAD